MSTPPEVCTPGQCAQHPEILRKDVCALYLNGEKGEVVVITLNIPANNKSNLQQEVSRQQLQDEENWVSQEPDRSAKAFLEEPQHEEESCVKVILSVHSSKGPVTASCSTKELSITALKDNLESGMVATYLFCMNGFPNFGAAQPRSGNSIILCIKSPNTAWDTATLKKLRPGWDNSISYGSPKRPCTAKHSCSYRKRPFSLSKFPEAQW
nr:hypothetical protein Iba_chr07eCG2230 [Ipomoea batatas]